VGSLSRPTPEDAPPPHIAPSPERTRLVLVGREVIRLSRRGEPPNRHCGSVRAALLSSAALFLALFACPLALLACLLVHAVGPFGGVRLGPIHTPTLCSGDVFAHLAHLLQDRFPRDRTRQRGRARFGRTWWSAAGRRTALVVVLRACEPVLALPSATLHSVSLGRMGIAPSGLCAVGHISGCTAPK
jgi:hypothetical protein